MTRQDIEVIAPVGSREALRAALDARADALYFGAGSLNMRARSAAAFGLADLPELAAAAADRGARSYLTLNVANTAALRFYARWADTVVLARKTAASCSGTKTTFYPPKTSRPFPFWTASWPPGSGRLK